MIQKLTYTWLTPWIARARKGFVYPDQMGLLSEADSCESVKKTFQQWLKYFTDKKYKQAFRYAYITTFWRDAVTNIGTGFIRSMKGIASAYLMMLLMDFISEGKQESEQDNNYGYFLVLAFFADQIFDMLLSAVIQLVTGLSDIKATSMVKSVIIEKLNNVSEPGNSEFKEPAKIQRLIGRDSSSVKQVFTFLKRNFTIPIDLITTGYILLNRFGYPFLFGMFILAVGPICTKILVDAFEPIWKEETEKSSKKYAAIKELIDNAKVIKLYGWVKNFINKVVAVCDEVDVASRKSAMFMVYYEPISVIMSLAP